MSRSNPTDRQANPSTCWWEWNGQHGHLSSWNKDEQKRVITPLPFQFMLLDELSTVTGWDDASESRIFSNEVRDTNKEPLIVKSYTGGTLVEGLYNKKDVEAAGGHYTASLYLAYKRDDEYLLGNLKLNRSSLGAWVDFKKEARKKNELYTRAIEIQSFKEGTKGSVRYRKPVFALVSLSGAAEAAALALDEELQSYLKNYLGRTTHDQVEAVASEAPPVHADDIPF